MRLAGDQPPPRPAGAGFLLQVRFPRGLRPWLWTSAPFGAKSNGQTGNLFPAFSEVETLGVHLERNFNDGTLRRGGLAVARSVQDQAFAERILAACRDQALAGLAADSQAPVKPRLNRKGK